MGKFKPLLASLATIAVAMLLLLGWSLLRDKPAPRPQDNGVAPPPSNRPASGQQYEIVNLDPRPTSDPVYLWPDDGKRMSSPEFWVMWKTQSFSDCRLIATKDGKLWHELGNTGGKSHYLGVDFGFFGSKVTFCVDFTQDGKKYRSKPRTVTLGTGAWFDRRQYTFVHDGNDQTFFTAHLFGRDPARISTRGFLHGWFTDDLVVYYSPQPGDSNGGDIKLGVSNPGAIAQGDGGLGFLEVYDDVGNTYDRTMIQFKRP